MSFYPLYLWLFALNTMCIIPFTYGPLTFACLLVSIWILWRMRSSTTPASSQALTTTGLTISVALLLLFTVATTIASFLLQPDPMIDIGINTVAATEAFANGLNPYTTRAQLWVEEFPADTPHLNSANGQITMYGLPYFHGYPYFPLMMLSYLPAWLFTESHAAIRFTHLFLVAMNLLAFHLLATRLTNNPHQQRITLLVAVTAWLGILRFIPETMILGITDLLISTWLLFCFVALSRQQYFIAGVLLGCAQACKLLPAPLVFLGICWLLYNRNGLARFASGFALACAIIILPFVAWHPEGFLSSTILYYLTHHQAGDITSLWYFLPAGLQGVFLLTGILLALASIVVFNRGQQKNLPGCMAGAYASYVIFMAFSKMTHLNYLWGILPLGCMALALFVSQAAQLHQTARK